MLIFSYLRLNDLIEASCVCKTFYYLSRKNKLYVKKLSDSRKLLSDSRLVFDDYYDSCLCFSNDLFERLKNGICTEDLYSMKDIIMNELFYKILPFLVWNHLFLGERSQYVLDMCLYCTKLYVPNKKISNYINKNLHLLTFEFPPEITRGVLSGNSIFLLAHTNAYSRNFAVEILS